MQKILLALELSLDVLKFILPELLINHFDLGSHKIIDGDLHLFFEEKPEIPEEFKHGLVISHGFHKEIAI